MTRRCPHIFKPVALASVVWTLCLAQAPPPSDEPPLVQSSPEEARIQKLQRNALVQQDLRDNRRDAKDLVQLAADLKAALDKQDAEIVDVRNIRTAEQIEKLARNIRNRLKRD